MSFGIPQSIFLYDQDGNMKEDGIEMCIVKLQHDATNYFSTKPFDGCHYVEFATEKDVLLGRGVPYQTHPGNVLMQRLVEGKNEEFKAARKFEKTTIAWSIVRTIQLEFGGRFLERCDDDEIYGTTAGASWKVCSDEDARLKVSVGFRSITKRERRRGDDVHL